MEIAKTGAYKEASALHKFLAGITSEAIKQVGIFSSDDESSKIGFADFLGASTIGLLLGLRFAVDSNPLIKAMSKSQTLDWNSPFKLLKLTRIYEVNTNLEHLSKWLNFEKNVEGKIVSPEWYIAAEIGIAYSNYIQDCINILHNVLKEMHSAIRSISKEEGSTLFVLAFCARMFELRHKLTPLLLDLKSMINAGTESLPEENRFLIKSIDIDKEISRFKVIFRAFALIAASKASNEPFYHRSDTIPDYFGRTLSWIGDELSDAMANDETEYFEKLFPLFFNACWSEHYRFVDRPELANQFRYRAKKQTFADLMSISGLALLYDELENKERWKVVKLTWDKFLESLDEPSKVVEYLALFSHRETVDFFYSAPDQVHHVWEMSLTEKVREQRPKDLDYFFKPYSEREVTILDYVFYDGMMMSHKPEIVFQAFYLATLSSAGEVQFGDEVVRMKNHFSKDKNEPAE